MRKSKNDVEGGAWWILIAIVMLSIWIGALLGTVLQSASYNRSIQSGTVHYQCNALPGIGVLYPDGLENTGVEMSDEQFAMFCTEGN